MSKADLEAREAQCSTVDDYVALAGEALAELSDTDYARHLLQQAEAQCQMPLDYLKPADVAASGLKDEDYARELYDQAEDMLFDAQEHIAFARSMALHLGDADKAREHLQTAANDASTPAEFLSMATLARDGLDDPELAGKFMASLQEKVKSLNDAAALARDVKEAGDPDAARGFFKQAARYCDDIAITVGYAASIRELFADDEWARSVLDEAESECQFTKEFVQLAAGYKELFGAPEKVRELMDQAAEFCMSGEEQSDLADGLWDLLGEKSAAADAYGKALVDISDKDKLLEMAGRAAKSFENINIAKQYYAKAEEKMSTAAELTRLAGAVLSDLNDRGYAAEVYDRAVEKLMNPGDLAGVAAELLERLEDKARATAAYAKSVERAGDLSQLAKLIPPIAKQLGDSALARAALDKALEVSKDTTALLGVAARAWEDLGDQKFARSAIQEAEERVATLGEMKSVVDQVKKLFPEDAAWVARVDEKLARRQANQAKYAAFQQCESASTRLLELVRLAAAVMEELEDVFYAKKLLSTAEQKWQQAAFDFNLGRDLILAVDRHAEDPAWTQRLLTAAAESCAHFSTLQDICRTAANDLTDTSQGRTFARTVYERWEQRLDAAGTKSAYDYTKLAKVIHRDLADADWAGKLIDKAAGSGGDHFAYARMGEVAKKIGMHDSAGELYEQAVKVCQIPQHAVQLAARLRSIGVDDETVRSLYSNAKPLFEDTATRLKWIEGIVQLFQDRGWASQEYDALGRELESDDDRLRYSVSRRWRLDAKLY